MHTCINTVSANQFGILALSPQSTMLCLRLEKSYLGQRMSDKFNINCFKLNGNFSGQQQRVRQRLIFSGFVLFFRLRLRSDDCSVKSNGIYCYRTLLHSPHATRRCQTPNKFFAFQSLKKTVIVSKQKRILAQGNYSFGIGNTWT